MKITKIRLKNFKRFTDLTIKDIPPTAKLVVVVGPNGCGKSSLFDGLLHWYRLKAGFGLSGDESYFRKSSDNEFNIGNTVEVTTANDEIPVKGSLYVRTAYRNDPDFSMNQIQRLGSAAEEIRVNRSIDNDQAVFQNYQRLVYDTMAGVYSGEHDTKTVPELREELIGQLRASMRAVFGDLVLNNIADPLSSGSFFFSKGTVNRYHFKNLSGGEKAAFDLLLDLHVKKKAFGNAVYCIDEMETHLHTRVQGLLLKEMVKILPENAQLWATSHSLGVLRAAQEMSLENPSAVCVIDFDGVKPDEPNEISPSNLGRLTWEKLLSIALDDLSIRVAPQTIIICEGATENASRRKNFDADIYNKILGAYAPEVVFISGGSSTQIAATGISVRQTLNGILPSTKVIALRDRDDSTKNEITEFEKSGNLVLNRRNLESFILDDEVLEAFARGHARDEFLPQILEIKRTAIFNSKARGNPDDDLKSASGEIFTQIKSLLSLQGAGNNADAFMKDILAPFITPQLRIYDELHAATLGRLSK